MPFFSPLLFPLLRTLPRFLSPLDRLNEINVCSLAGRERGDSCVRRSISPFDLSRSASYLVLLECVRDEYHFSL